MTQRNPMNDRYQDENRGGKTRKSSASAKPKAARAATVRDPAPKTKKQKKEEARERERKAQEKSGALQARFEETDTYKRLRRLWWISLGSAIACTAVSFVLNSSAFDNPSQGLQGFSMAMMIMAYVLIIVAFYIDLGKIRKERKLFNATLLTDKSKAARKEQKKLRAEQRQQEKEAAEKFEAAKAEEEAKRSAGLFARFRRSGANAAAGEADAEDKAED